jgi:hypothetical protein
MLEENPKNIVEINEKPIKTIEIGGVKLELGPDLDKILWNEKAARLEELNDKLKEGEKFWRLPTPEEFKEMGRNIRLLLGENNLSDEEIHEKIKEYVEDMGFSDGDFFWSDQESVLYPNDYALGFHTSSGLVFDGYKNTPYSARCVREV